MHHDYHTTGSCTTLQLVEIAIPTAALSRLCLLQHCDQPHCHLQQLLVAAWGPNEAEAHWGTIHPCDRQADLYDQRATATAAAPALKFLSQQSQQTETGAWYLQQLIALV